MADTTLTDPVAETPTRMNEADTLAQLTALKASATQQYSLRNYAAAADFYSEAAELQTLLNGEMSPDNADLLYAYGRCLYHVAVSNSDVLGGKVASEEPKKKKRKTKSAPAELDAADAPKTANTPLPERVVDTAVEQKGGIKEEDGNNAFFQITGDENWTDGEDEDEDEDAEAAADAEADEEEDDFANAYEILDVARVLLLRKLDGMHVDRSGKGKAPQLDELSPEKRTAMERLADTHDLQAEISLENERFTDAITDSRSALDLKLDLFPKESSLVAEAHYKLSLALEFASVTSTQAEDGAAAGQEQSTAQVDESLRKDAAEQMEAAIESCKLRVAKETEALSALDAEKKQEKEKSIKDVQEMVGDMEQRLVDLRNPAVSMNGVTDPAGASDGSNPLGGILGTLLGESAAQQKTRIEQATKGANDLTGLIRHKKQPKAEAKAPAPAINGSASGKRKLEEGDATANGKKVKFEEPAA